MPSKDGSLSTLSQVSGIADECPRGEFKSPSGHHQRRLDLRFLSLPGA
jgi:hypothetical protein